MDLKVTNFLFLSLKNGNFPQNSLCGPSGDIRTSVNGFSSCLLLCLLYVMGSGLGIYRHDLVFIHFSSIIMCLATVCITIFLFMLITYRCGDYYNVTTISEFCFGVELHPSVLDIDIKHFVRSRVTLVLWPLFIISAVYYQRNMYGKVSKGLIGCSIVQMVYIVKYHWTEYLALNSLDYKCANCGFYKLWSDMVGSVLFPVLYCSPIAVLAQTQKSISFVPCCILTVAAVFLTCLTTLIDKQKYEFRKSKGVIKIHGVDPFFITAKQRILVHEPTSKLPKRSGHIRHILCISRNGEYRLTSASRIYSRTSSVTGIFLGFLVVRLWNDESRCLAKYGQCWIQYCHKVPFRILPGIY
ncbi:hypothetical protein NECAME_04754 [Necator americanus]|uniref:7-dehydrocholesterol reductase n=1 Tax=Necator americanus TaxID=51031 RepID=W2SN10_NECAM|nr:hypothetical protein NECAME_04754 [Necator americanus]ETN70903.1 hypothetical protein NECAME_04754 [Necator americanus]